MADETAIGLGGGLIAVLMAVGVFLFRQCACNRYRVQCSGPDGSFGLMVRNADENAYDREVEEHKRLRAELEGVRVAHAALQADATKRVENLTTFFTTTLTRQFDDLRASVVHDVSEGLGRAVAGKTTSDADTLRGPNASAIAEIVAPIVARTVTRAVAAVLARQQQQQQSQSQQISPRSATGTLPRSPRAAHKPSSRRSLASMPAMLMRTGLLSQLPSHPATGFAAATSDPGANPIDDAVLDIEPEDEAGATDRFWN
jgi:hypothetical protein